MLPLRIMRARQPGVRSAYRVRQSISRRLKSTEHTSAGTERQAAGPAVHDAGSSIPSPGSWLMTTVQPLTAPFRAYDRVQRARPYTTQLLSSVVIYFLGDLSAQTLNPAKPTVSTDPADIPSSGYSSLRSLRAVTIGALFSIPSYRWFLLVSSLFNYPGRPLLSLAAKVALQQLAFAPFFNTYFFGMQSLLAGDGLDGAVARVVHAVPQSWVASCKFWPVVTAGIFAFVRPQHRSVFAGLVAIGWQTYLGILNQRASRELAAQKMVVG